MKNKLFDLKQARLKRLQLGQGALSDLEKKMLDAYDTVISAGIAIKGIELEVQGRNDQTLAGKTRPVVENFTALNESFDALIEHQFDLIEWVPDEAVEEV